MEVDQISTICTINQYSFILTNNGKVLRFVTKELFNFQRVLEGLRLDTLEHASVKRPKPVELSFGVKNSPIVQMVQGREHLLLLSIDGVVYGLGSNTNFQLTETDKKALQGNNEVEGRSRADSKYQRKAQRMETILKAKNDPFRYPIEIVLERRLNLAVCKVHATGDTSFAYCRDERVYFWGLNTVDLKMDFLEKVPEPLVVDNILGIGVDRNSNF